MNCLQKAISQRLNFNRKKKKLLKNVWRNEKYYTTYTCIDEAGKLLNAGAITEKEFEKIKKQAFQDENPDTRGNGGVFLPEFTLSLKE